ncbi:hypothetical protein BaRGS_00016542 [Batillaria attramentaria]|uniref:Breast cancer anti-estrogen resistance protein 1-like n=1 Tax=Batillaria attramentaria TaxID=370345 RepID=A0ABD0KYL9_9CAEN
MSGGDRHYETPPGSKRASLERILSDDQPTYDTPSPSRSHQELNVESTYDTPSSRRQSRDSTGAGSRSSMLSTASNESFISGSSSQLAAGRHSAAASLPDSARSSLDASLHEPYDLPSKETRALKQLSMDSGLGLYDTPGVGRPRPTSPQPPHLASSASHLSDLSREQRPPVDIKRSRSLEHALDDIYDSPRNNAPKISLKSTVPAFGSTTAVNHDPSAVYDIPPQVTRDSVISARSDSSDESLRLSSCSVDSRCSGADFAGVAEGVYEELLLDLDSALELLVKRQQDVTRASSRLMAFVSSTWRTKESLQTRVYDIKVACVEVKKALTEFVEFAQGTLANSARLSDKKLINRLVRQVTPLQQQRKTISAALRSLEEKKWQVTLLAEPLEAGETDDLGTITNLAKDLGPDVKKLASLIQGNSTLLFKRSSDLAAQSAAADTSHVASKPPIGPKPELVPKPNNSGVAGGNSRPRTLQQRPLPAPPGRPLPPTPIEVKLKALELTGSLDNLSDYMNMTEEASHQTKDDSDDRDYSDLAQEYDYVQLETCDVVAQQQSKEQQKKQDKEEQQDAKDQQTHQQLTGDQETDSKPEPPKTECLEPDQKPKTDNAAETQKPLQKHTARMSADLGDKMSDVDMVPTKDTGTADRSVSDASSTDIFDGSLQTPDYDADEQDLKTPVNMNGFKIPNVLEPLPASSAGFDLNGTTLDSNDKQVLVYYSGQLETHSTLLTNAIDAFFTCIENNEPPKVFISNSKFVIITAHKLVYISDALHRSLMNCEVRNKVMHCANHVCECLKVSVQATKMAALQYPSVPAVQEMVDRVVDVSHAAHELKLVITQASAL